MKKNNRKIGSDYEAAVAYYLEQSGYEILERNYRCKIGEIDLIARDGEYLVFCEVKFRTTRAKGNPMEAVNWKKQQTIIRCAQWYLMEQHLQEIPCRFDVVGVDGKQICLLKNAFMM